MKDNTTQNMSVTLPLLLVVAGTLLQYLLPTSGTLDKTLLALTGYKSAVWATKALIGVIVFLLPYWAYQKFNIKHRKKQIELLEYAIQIIEIRNYATFEQILEFRDKIKRPYFLKKPLEKVLRALLDDLIDLRDAREERKGNVTKQEKKSLVAKERKLSERIENMESTIDKYLRKIT